MGVDEGAVVAALVVASPNAIALTLAGALWNRPVAPLGPRLGVDELAHCIRGIGAATLVADAASAELARSVGAVSGAAVHVLPAEFERRQRDFDTTAETSRLVAYLHTSGTTGYPKAVPIREGSLARRVDRNAAALGLDRSSIYVTAAGYHHIAGLGMLFVVLGSGGVAAPYPSFSVDAWRALVTVGPTHGLLVPTQIDVLLEAEALRLPTLQVLQYGASPIHPETLRPRSGTLPGTRFVQIYGQTEGSPITILDHDDHLRALAGEPGLLASNGRAAPGVELELRADTAEHDGGVGGVGEVRARAEHFFACGPDGWLATGDLGRLDEHGYLTLVGRLGDGIVRGGENVFPSRSNGSSRRIPASRRSPSSVFPTGAWASASPPSSCRRRVARPTSRTWWAGAGSGSHTSRSRSDGSSSTGCRGTRPASSCAADSSRHSTPDRQPRRRLNGPRLRPRCRRRTTGSPSVRKRMTFANVKSRKPVRVDEAVLDQLPRLGEHARGCRARPSGRCRRRTSRSSRAPWGSTRRSNASALMRVVGLAAEEELPGEDVDDLLLGRQPGLARSRRTRRVVGGRVAGAVLRSRS